MKKTISDLSGFEDICNEKLLVVTDAGCSESGGATIPKGPQGPLGPTGIKGGNGIPRGH